jgi:hypothetical protein
MRALTHPARRLGFYGNFVMKGYGQSRHIRTEPTALRLTAALAGALIAALLAPATVNAAAWHRLFTTADRSVDIELAGMHRHGDVVLTWVRFSFVAVQHDPSARAYRSMLQQWAYQCAAERHALMQFQEFSDAAGTGMLVAADSRERYEWSHPAPDTLGAAALKFACAHDLDTSAILSRSRAKAI